MVKIGIIGDIHRHFNADDTTYVNAARVPRIFNNGGPMVHHHVLMTLEPEGVVIEEVLVRG